MPATTEVKLQNAEQVDFKIIHMPCCGHLLCWVNPRWPTYCPECGSVVYPLIKNPENVKVHQEHAILKW